MATLDLSFAAVSVPTNTTATVTIYEDVGADGAGGNTDPNGDSYDNSDTISLSDGVSSYTTADTFDGAPANNHWLLIECDNSDVEASAVVTAPVEISGLSAAAGSLVSTTGGGVDVDSAGVIKTV